jgi:hypothetical protein
MRKAKIAAREALARRSTGVIARDAGAVDDGATEDSDTLETDPQVKGKTRDCPRSHPAAPGRRLRAAPQAG